MNPLLSSSRDQPCVDEISGFTVRALDWAFCKVLSGTDTPAHGRVRRDPKLEDDALVASSRISQSLGDIWASRGWQMLCLLLARSPRHGFSKFLLAAQPTLSHIKTRTNLPRKPDPRSPAARSW